MKRRSQCARLSSGSAWASARATRRRTSSMLVSLPLAYFSISVSREISCAGSSAAAIEWVPVWSVFILVLSRFWFFEWRTE